MPNNLGGAIIRSGFSKKEVARLKGITPQTLSRVIHERINLNIQDVEEYAQILNCKPQHILFKTEPLPVIGYGHIDKAGNFFRNFNTDVIKHEIYCHNNFTVDTAVVMWSVDEAYDGPWYNRQGAIQFVKYSPVSENFVCRTGYERTVTAKINDDHGTIISGQLFPEPAGKYTVHTPWPGETATRRNLDLLWATPVMALSYRPDLSNIEIVEI